MRSKLLNRRIPTILGIIFILLGILLTTPIIKNQTMFKSSAINSQEPQNVRMTNISDQSFTVTYQTKLPSTGSISYGSDKKLGESGLEDADKQTGSFSPKKIHSISVNKLTPTTKYYLTIISGSNTFLNNGAPFEVTTGSTIASPSANQNEIKGKIVLPDGSIPPEALAYLSTENSQLLSTITAKDGKFSFSLKGLRTNDLSSYLKATDSAVFKISTTDGSLNSTVLVSLNQANSIPVITQSNNYDFTQEVSADASRSAKSLGFPLIIPSGKFLKPEILTPEENQSFTDQKPQFSGTSLPNEKVEIIIHSDEQITTQVTADGNGNWTYRPSNNLSPGVHTITIKTRDSAGILTTIMQSFTVFAAGSQISELATPSATPTVFPTVVILSPTVTPTSLPTPTLAQVVTKGGLPPPGDPRITFVTIAAIATTVAGIVLFLLTQKMPL
ncbi:MAG: hypothetical protein A3B47_04695 [Candidatus Levybacteria bacterium RIFCSPLOWO2_01_FULL_39_24]|nr:MAG: hypothetical protein A2800_04065 [Candidatus Levybacteria bacterium RIFCSPHIGHO2_01_FULL_40_16]OGH28027.1 MAG: hypothetical protein A3E12_01460 [Candidatus Levybacteria bacterium RIFCSPHIGHO2_12_FULL_39_9]OGH46743.1 MAG: hypothetical protein A3B47_04695 [Candidatus Levybacteria bacterium RIFCSPLOWO2_01_FULL_39_24]